MTFRGTELLTELEKSSLKMVFNTAGAIVFGVSLQHRDQKMPGISYEDDYQGNALAAMLSFKKIEIRFHRDFSDERVIELVGTLSGYEELARLRNSEVIYQGRTLTIVQ